VHAKPRPAMRRTATPEPATPPDGNHPTNEKGRRIAGALSVCDVVLNATAYFS
jgi:hypothetical protein